MMNFWVATDIHRYLWAVDNIDFHIPSVASDRSNHAGPYCIKHFDVIKNIAAGLFPRTVDFFFVRVALD